MQSGEGGGRLRGDEAVQDVPTFLNGVHERMSSQFIQHQRTEVDEGEGVHNVGASRSVGYALSSVLFHRQ